MKKVIFISGGSDGLGYETAKILSPHHTVIICSLNRIGFYPGFMKTKLFEKPGVKKDFIND